MRPAAAISTLQGLRAEAADNAALWRLGPTTCASWQQRVLRVLSEALGKTSDVAQRMRKNRWTPSIVLGAGDEHRTAWVNGAQRALGYIDAAIFALEQANDPHEDALAEADVDTELWEQVVHLVAAERWRQVASQTAIVFEDCVRRWCGNPRGSCGRRLFGLDLLDTALDSAGPLRLGDATPEQDGWRMVAKGFTAAASHVDRHGIQDRADARGSRTECAGTAPVPCAAGRWTQRLRTTDLPRPGESFGGSMPGTNVGARRSSSENTRKGSMRSRCQAG